MNQEQVTIKEILHIPIGQLAKYKVEDLYHLMSQASEELERVKRTKQWIESAISLKYEEHIKAKRLRLEKDTGVIHLEDNGFKISNDIPKKVEWDQQKLAKVATTIAINGGDLSDYLETHYTVSENKYNNWSSEIKSLFASARVLKLGKPTYKLAKLDGEVGS